MAASGKQVNERGGGEVSGDGSVKRSFCGSRLRDDVNELLIAEDAQGFSEGDWVWALVTGTSFADFGLQRMDGTAFVRLEDAQGALGGKVDPFLAYARQSELPLESTQNLGLGRLPAARGCGSGSGAGGPSLIST